MCCMHVEYRERGKKVHTHTRTHGSRISIWVPEWMREGIYTFVFQLDFNLLLLLMFCLCRMHSFFTLIFFCYSSNHMGHNERYLFVLICWCCSGIVRTRACDCRTRAFFHKRLSWADIKERPLALCVMERKRWLEYLREFFRKPLSPIERPETTKAAYNSIRADNFIRFIYNVMASERLCRNLPRHFDWAAEWKISNFTASSLAMSFRLNFNELATIGRSSIVALFVQWGIPWRHLESSTALRLSDYQTICVNRQELSIWSVVYVEIGFVGKQLDDAC